MRIYLQTPPAMDSHPRYCHLFLQEDLIGGWTLVKESGRQGSSGRASRLHFDDHDEALAALIAARDAQIKRGYRVVFIKGEQAPA
ncbi:MAG: WGR domain-containing protein [Gammaproteobacteria bacterium]|jgi:predicted DNA-binding WGR domain protein|nr:WGR domain-containing protein [Gammaproteobacteria bacterium]MCF6259407.1 WGR domain-containing protein [Gammaproteobacteria bacterium]